MRKIILAALIVCALGAASFKFASAKANATVDQKEGYYIFVMSKPTTEYEYMGSVKKGMSWTGAPTEMLNSIIKKVKKDYPKADAIIFTTIDMDKADAVKFKE
jgi:hypothetical protein